MIALGSPYTSKESSNFVWNCVRSARAIRAYLLDFGEPRLVRKINEINIKKQIPHVDLQPYRSIIGVASQTPA